MSQFLSSNCSGHETLGCSSGRNPSHSSISLTSHSDLRPKFGSLRSVSSEHSLSGYRFHYGLPANWISRDPRDPPAFESQAAYLRRLGLLLPGEELRLKMDDFVDELVLPELSEVRPDGTA
jgi:hypothetical protein